MALSYLVMYKKSSCFSCFLCILTSFYLLHNFIVGVFNKFIENQNFVRKFSRNFFVSVTSDLSYIIDLIITVILSLLLISLSLILMANINHYTLYFLFDRTYSFSLVNYLAIFSSRKSYEMNMMPVSSSMLFLIITRRSLHEFWTF